MRIKRWQLGVLAFCVSSCQLISGLDDLEADRKTDRSGLGMGDGGEAGSAAPDSGDDHDAGAVSGGSGVGVVAGSAAGSGNGGMSGGGAGAGGSADQVPVECKPLDGICDPVGQCGCPGEQNCAFFEGKLACVASGTVQPYARCSRPADCMKGYQCAGGVCTKACANKADDSCVNDASKCVEVAMSGNPVAGNYACTRTCNPAKPQFENELFDACGPGLGCTTIGDHSDCIQSTPTATTGASCKADGDCAPGFYCSVSMACERWCEVAGKDDCGSGSRCTGFASKEVVAKVEFGVCCAPPAGKGSCDTSPQCGCEATQRCDFVFTNGTADGTTACVSTGGVQEYGACSSQGECGKGYSCTDKACRQLCDLTRINSCASYSEFSHCLPVQVKGTDVPGWGVCSQVCNPAAPFKSGDPRFTACVTGTNCKHLGNGETNCLPLADPARSRGRTGDGCDALGTADGTLCAPGFFCDIGSLQCVQYCEVGAASSCDSGRTCVAFSMPTVKVATVTFGYCQ